jgi:hypothetical protein
MRHSATLALVVSLFAPLALPGAAAQEGPAPKRPAGTSGEPAEAADSEDSEAKVFSWNGDLKIAGLAQRGQYFGSPDQPSPDGKYAWSEGALMLEAHWRPADWVHFDVAGAATWTIGDDAYGTGSEAQFLFYRALVEFADIGGSGVGVTIGRQDLGIGSGLVISDGFRSEKAALWLNPIWFFDAVKVDWDGESGLGASGYAFLLDRTTGEPENGYGWGAELRWQVLEEGPEVAFDYVARHDTSATDNDARAAWLRSTLPFGPVTFGGDYVWEFGRIGGVPYDAGAWYAYLKWSLPTELDNYFTLHYAFFSGDDPATPEQEGYFSWYYGDADWSQWFIGDIVGSTLNDNTDEKTLWLEAAWTPIEPLLLRAYLHRMWVDTGAYHGVPEGVGKEFADEVDLTAEWTISERFDLWGVIGWARPLEAARAVYGDDAIEEIAAVFEWHF